VQMARATDTASDIARMQLAALNGTSEGTTVTTARFGADASTDDPTNPTMMTAQTVLTPSPQTARLAYLMLASLGV